MEKERVKVFNNWIKDKISSTYIKIGDEFKDCEFLQQKGWLK
jgi:hypothetical protein